MQGSVFVFNTSNADRVARQDLQNILEHSVRVFSGRSIQVEIDRTVRSILFATTILDRKSNQQTRRERDSMSWRQTLISQ